MGLDCTDKYKYRSVDDFLEAVKKAGYYAGEGSVRQLNELKSAVRTVRNNVGAFSKRSEAVLKHDAAIQLLLENMTIPGFDPQKGRAVLVRTENGINVLEYEPGHKGFPKEGELTYHNTGPCESHSHIQAFCYMGDSITVVSVPFHRIHGLWFIKRENLTGLYTFDNANVQFSGAEQNEIIVDTHGLNIIFVKHCAHDDHRLLKMKRNICQGTKLARKLLAEAIDVLTRWEEKKFNSK